MYGLGARSLNQSKASEPNANSMLRLCLMKLVARSLTAKKSSMRVVGIFMRACSFVCISFRLIFMLLGRAYVVSSSSRWHSTVYGLFVHCGHQSRCYFFGDSSRDSGFRGTRYDIVFVEGLQLSARSIRPFPQISALIS